MAVTFSLTLRTYTLISLRGYPYKLSVYLRTAAKHLSFVTHGVDVNNTLLYVLLSIEIYRMDADFRIKVADFGLSQKLYSKNYFKQRKDEGDMKLPFKWMAIESLCDGVFSEKSDVVS